MAKKLFRSRQDKMIGGVCGGLAQYLDIDPTIVRVIGAILIFFTYGVGLAAYILAWILVPEDPGYGEGSGSVDPDQRRKLIGGVLIGIGGLLFLGRFFPWFDFKVVLAIVLVAAGVYIIVHKR
jgi:phage shock protein C